MLWSSQLHSPDLVIHGPCEQGFSYKFALYTVDKLKSIPVVRQDPSTKFSNCKSSCTALPYRCRRLGDCARSIPFQRCFVGNRSSTALTANCGIVHMDMNRFVLGDKSCECRDINILWNWRAQTVGKARSIPFRTSKKYLLPSFGWNWWLTYFIRTSFPTSNAMTYDTSSVHQPDSNICDSVCSLSFISTELRNTFSSKNTKEDVLIG